MFNYQAGRRKFENGCVKAVVRRYCSRKLNMYYKFITKKMFALYNYLVKVCLSRKHFWSILSIKWLTSISKDCFHIARLTTLSIMIQSIALLTCLNTISLGAQEDSYITKAQKFQTNGEHTKAINEYYKCLKKNPSNPYAYYHLGVISEAILNDYDSVILYYEKALSLHKFKRAFLSKDLIPVTKGAEEETRAKNKGNDSIKKIDVAVADINSKKKNVIKKIFHSIEKPVSNIYVVIKPKKDVYSKPINFTKVILKGDPDGQREFEYVELRDNWYMVKLPSGDEGWVKWKDINVIYQSKTNPVRLSNEEKAEKYQSFTTEYQNSPLVEKARDKADRLYYKIANEIQSKNSFEEYLEKYPNGQFVTEAKNKKAELTFEEIRDDKDELIKFVHQYPESQFSKKAQGRIEELTYEQAKSSNDLNNFYAYLNAYPEGRFFKEVEDRILILELKEIDRNRYEKARKIDTLGAYKKFIKKYPKSNFITNVRERIEEVSFENAKSVGTIKALRVFLKKYPDSSFTNIAKRKIDIIQYEPYKSRDTEDAYKKFINKFPDNQFVDEARGFINKPQSKDNENVEEVTGTSSQAEQHKSAKEQGITNKLEKLERFYKKGLIDEEEYKEKKAEILQEL